MTSVIALLDDILGGAGPEAVSSPGFVPRFMAAGLATAGWPRHYGGLDASSDDVAVINDTIISKSIPLELSTLSTIVIGTTLLSTADATQRERWLPPIARGAAIWTQLFSEPGAGSDLAALRTRAVRDGGGWVVNGQKTWSSHAAHAQWGLLLARTGSDDSRHRGITAFAVDMAADGVTRRPITMITGDTGFCEVFLDNVVVPDRDRISDVDAGWAITLAMLKAERTLHGGQGASPLNRIGGISAAAVVAELRGSAIGEVERDRLCRAFSHERVIQWLLERTSHDPEMSSLVKLAKTESNRSLQSLRVDLAGLGALAAASSDSLTEPAWAFLRSRSNTIAGGTSEILRDTIGHRLLGLPRG